MRILGIISLLIALISGAGIFILKNKDEKDMAMVCVWITAIAAVIGIVLLFLPGILNPSKV